MTHDIIQDDDSSLQYTPNWSTYGLQGYDRPHPLSNNTYHQIDMDTSGSVTFAFSGKYERILINVIFHLFSVTLGEAILVYGIGWSSRPSTFRVSVDNGDPTTLFNNSSLSNSTNENVYFDGLLFSYFDLAGLSHRLTIDNDNGAGRFGLDYIEIITVTDGST